MDPVILSFVEATTVVYLLHAWVTLSLGMRKGCVYSHISDLSEFCKVVPLGKSEALWYPISRQGHPSFNL